MAVETRAPAAGRQLSQHQISYNEKLKFVMNKIHAANNVNEILIKLKDVILSLFDGDRITIYLHDPARKQLVSKFMVGTEIREIRVPVSPASIAGFAAFSMKLVNIADAYDPVELGKIDPRLVFDKSWDEKSKYRTKQILATPIIFENKLLGVIQIINKKSGKGTFTKLDEKCILEVAQVLGIAFRNQSRMIHTRFDHLIAQNIITANDLKTAMAEAREAKKDVEVILMEKYKIKKADIGIAQSMFYGCKFVEYNESVFVQRELLRGLNVSYLKKTFWIPLSLIDGKATILVDNPRDPKIVEIKNLIKAREYEFQVALKQDILKFIEAPEKEEAGGPGAPGSMTEILAEMDGKEDIMETISSDAAPDENASTIVKLVNQIIVDGYEKGASDIHIEPSKTTKTTIVRYRADGACMKHLEIPLSYSRALSSRIKIMANLDISERRLPQDGKIKFIYKNKPIELRVATLPTVGGEDVVMRILASSHAMTMEELNLNKWNYDNFKDIIQKPYGIILVVGPTGSGKTTTLHSAIALINTVERKIWTAEDPVEITQEGLRQVEMKPKIDLTFARAMRSFLRADPDVIMVGEMRDHETAAIGMEASLTGHLVFSTLHTNSAPETVTRLIDMDIDPFNFADALLGILAQRLARTLCKKCKETYKPSREEFDALAEAYGPDFPELKIEYNDSLTLYRAKGCEACNNTGYKGRTGLHELLLGTKNMKAIIQRKAMMEEIRAQALKDGMRTLFQDGIQKIFKGQTDLKQVKSVCMQ